jgi:hypothetical protein
MIIESEHANPHNNNHPFDFQGSLATVDHNVPADFSVFHAMYTEIQDAYAHTTL